MGKNISCSCLALRHNHQIKLWSLNADFNSQIMYPGTFTPTNIGSIQKIHGVLELFTREVYENALCNSRTFRKKNP